MFWQLSWISYIPLHFPLYRWFIPNSFSCWRQLNKHTFAHCSAERNNFSGTVVQNQTPCLKMSPVPNAACEWAWDKSRFSWCVPRAGVLASMSFNTFKDRVTAVFSWSKERPKNSKTRQGNKQKVGDVVIKAVRSHYPCTHCCPPPCSPLPRSVQQAVVQCTKLTLNSGASLIRVPSQGLAFTRCQLFKEHRCCTVPKLKLGRKRVRRAMAHWSPMEVWAGSEWARCSRKTYSDVCLQTYRDFCLVAWQFGSAMCTTPLRQSPKRSTAQP